MTGLTDDRARTAFFRSFRFIGEHRQLGGVSLSDILRKKGGLAYEPSWVIVAHATRGRWAGSMRRSHSGRSGGAYVDLVSTKDFDESSEFSREPHSRAAHGRRARRH